MTTPSEDTARSIVYAAKHLRAARRLTRVNSIIIEHDRVQGTLTIHNIPVHTKKRQAALARVLREAARNHGEKNGGVCDTGNKIVANVPPSFVMPERGDLGPDVGA